MRRHESLGSVELDPTADLVDAAIAAVDEFLEGNLDEFGDALRRGGFDPAMIAAAVEWAEGHYAATRDERRRAVRAMLDTRRPH